MVREIDSVTDSWATDIETYVKYVPKEISLRKSMGDWLYPSGNWP